MTAPPVDTDEQDVAPEGTGHARLAHTARTYRAARTAAETASALRAQLRSARQALAHAVAELREAQAMEEWLTNRRVWSRAYYTADGTRRVILSYWHSADRVTSCDARTMREAYRLARAAIDAADARDARNAGRAA